MVDPAKARDIVVNTLREHDGNAHQTAAELGVSYHTLWRLIGVDEVLSKRVAALRAELDEAGITQRGWNG